MGSEVLILLRMDVLTSRSGLTLWTGSSCLVRSARICDPRATWRDIELRSDGRRRVSPPLMDRLGRNCQRLRRRPRFRESALIGRSAQCRECWRRHPREWQTSRANCFGHRLPGNILCPSSIERWQRRQQHRSSAPSRHRGRLVGPHVPGCLRHPQQRSVSPAS